MKCKAIQTASKPKTEQVIDLLGRSGVVRSRDLNAHGIARQYLQILLRQGRIRRVGKGLYISADLEPTENHSLAEAGKQVPKGVICLLSALRFHGLTTQAPFEVWMAIDRRAWSPRPRNLQLRIVRFSGKALTAGIEEHLIEGVTVRVYNPAKTVADCFKYRNKIGLDIAIEALRDCRRQRKCKGPDLWEYAKVCRVANVMRPYLEATL
jgi:predicted transcriptional regulator of viral defense system